MPTMTTMPTMPTMPTMQLAANEQCLVPNYHAYNDYNACNAYNAYNACNAYNVASCKQCCLRIAFVRRAATMVNSFSRRTNV